MQFDYFPCNGCKWLQVAAESKWLQVAAPVAAAAASGCKWPQVDAEMATCSHLPWSIFSQITTWMAQWLWLFSLVFESFPAWNSAHQPVQKVTPTFFPHGTPMISGQNLS
jgi:hypothetical protein